MCQASLLVRFGVGGEPLPFLDVGVGSELLILSEDGRVADSIDVCEVC